MGKSSCFLFIIPHNSYWSIQRDHLMNIGFPPENRYLGRRCFSLGGNCSLLYLNFLWNGHSTLLFTDFSEYLNLCQLALVFFTIVSEHLVHAVNYSMESPCNTAVVAWVVACRVASQGIAESASRGESRLLETWKLYRDRVKEMICDR